MVEKHRDAFKKSDFIIAFSILGLLGVFMIVILFKSCTQMFSF